MTYRCILADPPWKLTTVGRWASPKHGRPDRLPYDTLSQADLMALPVGDLAAPDCHLWLWSTNQHLRDAFDLMSAWSFKYLTTITWVKPSGVGAHFVSRTQHLLMGYRGKLDMRAGGRFRPTVLFGTSPRHSQKPECAFELIEAVSHPARLELFARKPRDGWAAVGNEVGTGDVRVSLAPVPGPGGSTPCP